jgi:hypothetical protein
MEEKSIVLLNLFQTTIRNIGLYISVSFGALGYSRFYRNQNKVYNIALIIVSILFSLGSYILSKNLLHDLNRYKEKGNKKLIDKYLIIPNTTIYISLGLTLLATFTLFREVFN